MISSDFIKMLRCPENRTVLQAADDDLIRRINAAIAARQLKNKAGQTLDSRIDGGLVREDGLVLYPVLHEIPRLLIDEGIALDQVASDSNSVRP